MKIIAIITFISLFSISSFWYLEVATPYQQDFVKEKASNTGTSIKEKSLELYENRDKYIDKAKELGQKAKELGEAAINKVSGNTTETNSQK